MLHITDATFGLGVLGNILALFYAAKYRHLAFAAICGWRLLIDLFLVRMKCERWFNWSMDPALIKMLSPIVQWGEFVTTPLFYVLLTILLKRAATDTRKGGRLPAR